jgi:predicted nucleic acid-binding protein
LAVVVSDTSPVRALAHLGLLELVRHLFGQALVPPAVAGELRAPPAGLPDVGVGQLPFLRVQSPQDQARVQQFRQSLDPGESEALALALEVQASAVLMDEAAGRAMARQVGLQPLGILGLLLLAKQRGLVPAVSPLMDRLEQELGFFLSAAVRAEVLRLAGE